MKSQFRHIALIGKHHPPVAGGMRRDGSGVLHVVRTPGVADAVALAAPGLTVREVDVPGPPTSAGYGRLARLRPHHDRPAVGFHLPASRCAGPP